MFVLEPALIVLVVLLDLVVLVDVFVGLVFVGLVSLGFTVEDPVPGVIYSGRLLTFGSTLVSGITPLPLLLLAFSAYLPLLFTLSLASWELEVIPLDELFLLLKWFTKLPIKVGLLELPVIGL